MGPASSSQRSRVQVCLGLLAFGDTVGVKAAYVIHGAKLWQLHFAFGRGPGSYEAHDMGNATPPGRQRYGDLNPKP